MMSAAGEGGMSQRLKCIPEAGTRSRSGRWEGAPQTGRPTLRM